MNYAFSARSRWSGGAALLALCGLGLCGGAVHAQDVVSIPVNQVWSPTQAASPVASLDNSGQATDHGYRIYRVPVARYDAGVVAHLLCRTGIAVVPPNYVATNGQNGTGQNGQGGNVGAQGGVLPLGNGSLGGSFNNRPGGFPGSGGFPGGGTGFNPSGVTQGDITLPGGSQTTYNNGYNNAPFNNGPLNGSSLPSGTFQSGAPDPQFNGGLPGTAGTPGAGGQETLPEGVRTIYAHEGNNSLVIEATPEAFARLMQRFRALAF